MRSLAKLNDLSEHDLLKWENPNLTIKSVCGDVLLTDKWKARNKEIKQYCFINIIRQKCLYCVSCCLHRWLNADIVYKIVNLAFKSIKQYFNVEFEKIFQYLNKVYKRFHLLQCLREHKVNLTYSFQPSRRKTNQ